MKFFSVFVVYFCVVTSLYEDLTFDSSPHRLVTLTPKLPHIAQTPTTKQKLTIMGCCQSKAPVRSSHDISIMYSLSTSKTITHIHFPSPLLFHIFIFIFPFCRFSLLFFSLLSSLFSLSSFSSSASSSPSHPPSPRERQSGPSTTTTRHKLFLPLVMVRNQKNQKRNFILGIVIALCQFVTQRQVLHQKQNHQG